MELLSDFKPLSKVIPENIEQVHQISDELMAAVRYLHSEGVCHRDLHPGNVLINTAALSTPPENREPGQILVKLIDFNVATKFEKSDCDQVRGGTGYKHWSAPETRTSLCYSSKCDSYSCGLLIAHMLESALLLRQTTASTSEREEVDFEEVGPDLNNLKNFFVSNQAVSGNHWSRLLDGLLQMEPSERWSPEQAAEYLNSRGSALI